MSSALLLAASAPLVPLASEQRIGPGTVAAVMGGGFVVSQQPTPTTWAVQRHGADGQAVGAPATLVPTMLASDAFPGDTWPTMVALTGGGYAVTWLRLVQFERFGGSLYQLHAQSFTAAGVPTGSPVAIAQTIPARYWIGRPIALPRLAALNDGGFVVVWALPSFTDDAVYVQRFNADGTTAGPSQQVTADGSGSLGVTGLATGGYMVTWNVGGGQGNARAYSSTDVPVGPAQPIGLSFLPFVGADGPTVLAPLAGGGAVRVWLRPESSVSPTSYVHVVPLAPYATAISAPTIVDGSTASNPPHDNAPAVAGLADGGYVVAWVESGEVHARRFTASGAPAGEETRINLATTSVEQPVAVAALAGGGFIISWSGIGTDGIRSIYSRVFPVGGLAGA